MSNVNAQVHPSPEAFAIHLTTIPAPRIWVSQHAAGGAITQVKQSTMAENNSYWMNVALEETVHSVEFIATYKQGSPLTDQRQSFHFPNGYAGTTTTPFGVPYWGGDPILGAAHLIVLADGLYYGSYAFTVIA